MVTVNVAPPGLPPVIGVWLNVISYELPAIMQLLQEFRSKLIEPLVSPARTLVAVKDIAADTRLGGKSAAVIKQN